MEKPDARAFLEESDGRAACDNTQNTARNIKKRK
jgi:hypothetical protein